MYACAHVTHMCARDWSGIDRTLATM